jgi:hypothetical protein
MNNKKIADIDPRSLAADLFHRIGGPVAMEKWGKTHRSLAYQLIAKLMAQPLIQNNVAVSVSADDGEAARRKLETAMMRVINARKLGISDGDPAVYVDGERVYDDVPRLLTRDPPPSTDDIQPSTAGARPATMVDGDVSSDSKSAKKGTVFSGGGVETTAPAGQKNQNVYSKTFPSFPGLAAGASLDGSDDNRSTTQKYLDWSRRGGGMP